MASLTKKIVNGRPYYYLRESAWVDGRPKVVKTTYLGRAEDIETRLGEEPGEPKRLEVRCFGAVAAAVKLCRELEVAEAIDRALGAGGAAAKGLSVGQMIMLAAINRACGPRSKRQLADWHSRSALARLMPAPSKALSSQRFWDAMDVLSEQAIAKAEREIVRRLIDLYGIELRPLIYDTTNFATFIDSANARNTIAKRGHAKGGRHDLRLIGLALCVALDSNIPLCHQTYEGNRNDATQFRQAIELIKARLVDLGLSADQLAELTLVYDKGNNSKENQPLADALGLSVVGSLSPSKHPELLQIAADRFHEIELGIVYDGREIDGFPYIEAMETGARLRVARWADSLAPEAMTDEQRELLAGQPPRKISARRVEGIRQDRILHSSPVQSFWRSLDKRAQEFVLNPDLAIGKRYPLSTVELARLTGLTRRQVQHWSDRRLLPHWSDARGHRMFEAPAAIVAFALHDRKQHERQFYADLGFGEQPLLALRDAVNIVGMRTLDLAEDADPQELADTEQAFRAVADSIRALRVRPGARSRSGSARRDAASSA